MGKETTQPILICDDLGKYRPSRGITGDEIIMGGYGSGRWGTGKSNAKTLIESCHALNVDSLVREGIVDHDVHHRAAWEWLDCSGENAVASISLDVRTHCDSGTMRLHYRLKQSQGEADLLNYSLPLVTSRLPSGGLRWWFRCSAACKGGSTCGKRVRVLYLPRRQRVFACRTCHDLAYSSSRESRKYTSLFNQLGAKVGVGGRTVEKLLRSRSDLETKERVRAKERGRIEKVLSAVNPQTPD